MISKKAQASKEAEKARQQAMLKACGYTALKNKHRKSLRPALPDLKKASNADIRPHPVLEPG